MIILSRRVVVVSVGIVLFIISFLFSYTHRLKDSFISPLDVFQTPTSTPSPTPFPILTVERIFDEHESINNENFITVVVTGDVIPARSVNRLLRQKNDFSFAFAQSTKLLKDADITLINLEAPLIDGCPTTDEGMVFCGDPKFASAMALAGIDIANLANNHVSNYGSEGVKSTEQLLRQHGILPVGIGNIEYITIKGMNFAFLGYNGVVPFVDELTTINTQRIAQDIKIAKQKADVVFVSFHWGKEYVRHPQVAQNIAPFDPIEIGHATIDAGADVVVGNHPHWYQGIELYKGKPIFYALGNFIFDQFFENDTQRGFVAKLYFSKKHLVDISLHPVILVNTQPHLAEEPLKTEIVSTMKEASLNLNGR